MASRDNPGDVELVARATAGDPAALSTLYVRHRDRLRLLVRYRIGRKLRQRLESEDVLQSAFARAVRRFGSERLDERHFLGWIVTAIDHTLRDRARWFGARKRAGREIGAPDPDATIAFDGARPSEALRERENLAALQRALDGLSHRDRELILLTRIEGHTAAEAGAVLGIVAGTAQRAVTRALARLAARMA